MKQGGWSLPKAFVGENLVEKEWKEYQKTYEIAIQTEIAIRRLGRKRPSNIAYSKDVFFIKHEGLIYECICFASFVFWYFQTNVIICS